MDFKYYLKEQAGKHPSMTPQDIIKMCYQAAFGAEHLLEDIKAAEEYFNSEFEAAEESAADLYEPVSPEFCRVNLGAWKKRGLPKERLFELFTLTAGQKNAPERDIIFSGYVKAAGEIAEAGEFPFSYESWRDFVAEYEKGGVRPVRHSEQYRAAEAPAYRIVASELVGGE